jgi:hypothetical protein
MREARSPVSSSRSVVPGYHLCRQARQRGVQYVPLALVSLSFLSFPTRPRRTLRMRSLCPSFFRSPSINLFSPNAVGSEPLPVLSSRILSCRGPSGENKVRLLRSNRGCRLLNLLYTCNVLMPFRPSAFRSRRNTCTISQRPSASSTQIVRTSISSVWPYVSRPSLSSFLPLAFLPLIDRT